MKPVSKIITTVLLAAVCSSSAFAQSINIGTLTDGDSGTGWSFTSRTLTINGDGGTYTIKGTTITNSIVVTTGITANITLDGVNIDPDGDNSGNDVSAFDMAGATVNLTLEGSNTLKGYDNAGLHVPMGIPNSTLNITAASSGSLEAAGGDVGAGIGGSEGESCGTVTISGGTVTAIGGSRGAGIGGGNEGNGGTVTISGGTVTASSGYYGNGNGAGIGGGYREFDGNGGDGGTVIISGGTVTATGGGTGAGIGGGGNGGDGGTVIISSGTVTAIGGNSGAGIGGSNGGNGGNITISGGTVTATSVNCAGIGGGGNGGNGGNITISGGTVTATGGSGSAGIGGGAGSGSVNGGDGGTVTISGGTVTATGSEGGAGIGGGGAGSGVNGGGDGGTVTISGGTVTATANDSYIGAGAAIGGGNGGYGTTGSGDVIITGGSVMMNNHTGPQPTNGTEAVYPNTLTLGASLGGKSVAAGSIDGVACGASANAPAGVYGIKDVDTDASGTVCLYLTATDGEGTVILDILGVKYGLSYTRSDDSDSPPQTVGLFYGITLSPPGTHTFTGNDYGYATPPAAHTVTVTNTGNPTANQLGITLSGGVTSAFTLSSATISTLGIGGTGSFIVGPKANLDAGLHEETVTLSGSDGITASFTVSFTVGQATPGVGDLTVSIPTGVIYNGSVQKVDVTKQTGAIGDITTVKYKSGSVETTDPIAANTYTVTASIAANTNYTAVDLNLGSYTIHRADPTLDELYYTAPIPSVSYSGSPQPLTVTAKSGVEGLGTVTVKYKGSSTLLPVGADTYPVTVSIAQGDNYNSTVVDLPLGSYTIDQAVPQLTDLNYIAPTPVTYNGSAHPVAVTDGTVNTGLGAFTVYYGVSTDAPVNVDTYPVTVAVAGNANYTSATLPLGDLVINQAVPQLTDLTYIAPTPVTYNGSAHPVAVTDGTVNTGLGAFTVYYGVSTDAPVNVDTYPVTVAVAGNANYTSATLPLGNLVINQAVPTLDELDYPAPIPSVTYDGLSHAVTVTDKTITTGLGTVSVYYNGSPTAPVNADTYAVTVDVGGGTNYAPATGLSPGAFTIAKAALTKDHLDYTLASVPHDGSPHGLSALPALKAGYSNMGTVLAVHYTGTGGTNYPESPNAPVDMGTYTVTVDVSGGTNFNLITGLSLGTFSIGKTPLTTAHFDCALADTTYDGTPHGIATPTLQVPHTGMGTLTVYYTSTDGTTYPKSSTAPVNAGDYDVTVDVTEGSIFDAAFDLPLGSYMIAPAEPTVDDLDFDLSDIVDTGKPLPGIGVGSAAGFGGLGEVTVKYDGFTQIPSLPGTYTVTVDIAAGDNYEAITGLVLGTFTVYEPVMPVIRRRVTLLPATGLTTDPPANTYYIGSGANFTFTLTPDVPSPDGTPPQVQTTAAPDGSGISMTANADGSYTVVIAGIRQDIDVILSIPADNAPVADGALRVGTAPGVLVVANGRPAPVTLHVYNLAGTLIRLTAVPPGTTRLSVPTGIYIVTDGGAFRQKRVVTR